MGEFRFGKCAEIVIECGFVGLLGAESVGFLLISFSLLLNPSTTPENNAPLERNKHRQPNDGYARSQTLSSPPWHATRETLLCLVSSSHPGTLRCRFAVST